MLDDKHFAIFGLYRSFLLDLRVLVRIYYPAGYQRVSLYTLHCFNCAAKLRIFHEKRAECASFFLYYCNSHSNAETMWMAFPSTTTSRVCVNAISVRRLQERASDALTSDEVSRSYARGLSTS